MMEDDKIAKGMTHWDVGDYDVFTNYTRWQAGLILPFLGQKVLEVGSSGGPFSLLLNSMRRFDRYIALEPSPTMYAHMKERCPNVESYQKSMAT